VAATAERFGLRVPAGAAGDLPALLHEHGLVVLEDSHLHDDAFVALARTLGEPARIGSFRSPGSAYVRVQSSVRGLGAVSTGEYWHADGPLEDPPAKATLLLCDEAPGATGATLFVDMRAAFERLPRELAARVATLRGRYPCRGQPKLSHPLVRTHPVTGRRALYLNERWLRGVAGCGLEESRAILAALYAVATDPDFVYEHRWRTGDLLAWDNAIAMHKAMPVAYGARKVSRRITLRG
jgi:taurine dioxygenase